MLKSTSGHKDYDEIKYTSIDPFYPERFSINVDLGPTWGDARQSIAQSKYAEIVEVFAARTIDSKSQLLISKLVHIKVMYLEQ